MKKLWLFSAVLLIVVVSDCLGRPRGSSRRFGNSAEIYQDTTPEHVITIKKEADGMLAGEFDGFDDSQVNRRSAYLNADSNGRQASRHSSYSSRRRAKYSDNEYDDNEGYGDGYSDNSRESYGTRRNSNSNYGSRDNSYDNKDSGYDKNDGYGDSYDKYDEKDDYSDSHRSSNYGNKGYSNSGGNSYRDDSQDYNDNSRDSYGSRSSGRGRGHSNNNYGDYENSHSYNGHRNRYSESGDGYRGDRRYHSGRGGSNGRQSNHNGGGGRGGGGGYNRRRVDPYRAATGGMSDIEAAQALYTGNPQAGHSNLDGIVGNKPVYLGEYDEKSPLQGKPRSQIGDYLYGENMVF